MSSIARSLRQYVDAITMYRVVLFGLLALVTIALTLSFFGVLTYASFSTLLLTLGVLSVVSFSVNVVLAKLFSVTPNFESSIITTLILFFVLAAPSSALEWVGIALAATGAIASKYLLTWRSSPIFNPAAFGVLAVSLIGVGSGAWWIADATLFLPTLLIGFLILYKLRRFALFFAFAMPAIVLILLQSAPGSPLGSALLDVVTLYPILFLGTIMLTEPHTMPNQWYDRLVYGALVGVGLASTFDTGYLSSSPHLALLIGNIFAFAVTTRAAATLTLVNKKRMTPTTYSLRFKPDKPIPRAAGQYMEFTLDGVSPNTRGNRRTFSIASAPSDECIELGVKFYTRGSSFKTRLQAMKPGDNVSASNVAGEFVLRHNSDKPLVFLAGGIGITPFIAMLKEVITCETRRRIDLYYFVSEASEVAYKEVLTLASDNGIRVHTRIGRDQGLTAHDLKNHTGAEFYVSGPPGLVDSYRTLLHSAGIKRIHTDYFTGY